MSGSYGFVTMSTSGGLSAASDAQQSQKDSRNHAIETTRKSSARVKKDRKVSFRVTSAAGTEDQAVRTITNPSMTDAMRVDYFSMVRRWKVELFRYGLRMTYDIAIPDPGSYLRKPHAELAALDAQLASPFDFPLTAQSIQRNNWAKLAGIYDAQVSAPPPQATMLVLNSEINPPDVHKYFFGTIQIDVPAGYYIYGAALTVDTQANPESGGGELFWNPYFAIMHIGSVWTGGAEQVDDLSYLVGRTDRQYVVYNCFEVGFGVAQLEVSAMLTDDAFSAWQLGAWTGLRQAAFEKYQTSRQSLQEKRNLLADQIARTDVLVLRREEREEIMKGVLRWLFGPSFELMPADVQALFATAGEFAVAPATPSALTEAQWQRMYLFQEFVKYIHQAIEWENVLYFLYPYFWDDPTNWEFVHALSHPDPTRQNFLRAGSARIVLTIRPGFETSFTQLVELGVFSSVAPPAHPYLTVAEEIRNYAATHYDGIPAANPAEPAANDAATETAERGELVAQWYEYTPTSALDISINTSAANLA